MIIEKGMGTSHHDQLKKRKKKHDQKSHLDVVTLILRKSLEE